jgi:dihydroorotate dehydrogenase (fumarate)
VRITVVPCADLSTRSDASSLRLPLRWIGILYGRVEASLAGSGGVHSAEDVLKLLLDGADVAMLASELIVYGSHRLAEIRLDLEEWMTQHEFMSIRHLRGTLS